MNHYEAIAIDANISALATACLIQHSGIKTAVLCNPNDIRNRALESMYYWDSENGALSIVLDKLEVEKNIGLKKSEFVDRLCIDDKEILRSPDVDLYLNELIKAFPNSKDELVGLFNDMKNVSEEWLRLLKAGSVFLAGPLKNMMQFRNTTYEEYLREKISDESLQNILLLDCDKKDAAFVVISGYVCSQILDGNEIDNIDNIYRFFYDCFKRDGGTVIECDCIDRIQKNGELFEIYDNDENEYICGLMFSSYSTEYVKKSYFKSNDSKQVKGVDTGYVIIDSESDIERDISLPKREKLLYGTKKRSIINVFIDGKRLIAKLVADNEIEIDDDFIQFLKKRYAIEKCQNIEVFSRERLEKEIGIMSHDIQGWEFTNNEMKKNVMDIKSDIEGFFPLGEWGCAYFTSAICAANAISKKWEMRK